MFDGVLLVFHRILELYSAQIPVLLGFAALFTVLAMFERAASSPGKYWWRNPGLVKAPE